ncbi:hypothetical protein [Neisseria meningitidis]|uniref:hypothetical protein n=1 Tax=Neisseria meningitidis TaxID=487 RepID=UPI0003A7514A|nr:hypothetical protein [Neisseria meningitidis]
MPSEAFRRHTERVLYHTIQNPFFIANRLQTALLPYPDLNLTCHTNRLQTAL